MPAVDVQGDHRHMAGMTFLQWITDFADQAVVLPVACAVLLFLLLSRWWRGAIAWATAIICVLATMLVLKLFIGACGWELPFHGLASPSGHCASSAMLYGGCGVLLVRGLSVRGAAILALGVAVFFAVTRVSLGYHTVPEALLGGIVGVTGGIGLRRLAGPPPERLRRVPLALLVLVVALAFHGGHLPAERNLHSFAATRLRTLICPLVVRPGQIAASKAWGTAWTRP